MNPHREIVVGDILLTFAPFFKDYSAYCNNHPRATELLTEVRAPSRKRRCVTLTEMDARHLRS